MNGKRYTKRIFSLLIVCTLLVTLTGCTGNQADMSLKEDGTCSVTIRFLYENSYYNLLQQSNSEPSSKSTEESEPEYAIESGDFTEGSLANGLKQNSKNPTIYDKVTDTLFKDVTLTSTLFKASLTDSVDDLEKAASKKGELVKSGSSSDDC